MSLLTACEQPGSTTVRAPNDLNGVWRLAQITYILGDTWSIMANEPTQTMRLYDGDSVFYEFEQRNDASGTIIEPKRYSHFTNIYIGHNNFQYFEEEDPHPFTRENDSTIFIQDFGRKYMWVRSDIGQEQAKLVRAFPRGEREARFCVISAAEKQLKEENYLLANGILASIIACAALGWYTYVTIRRKRHIERQLKAIGEEAALRPAQVEQAMKAVEREFKGSDWYVTIQRRIGHGERITEADWEEIERQLKVVYPNFVRNLSGLCRFSDVEWRTCLLIKLDVAPSDIAQTLHREASSISTIRSRLFQKVFDRKGSSREWDEFIASL